MILHTPINVYIYIGFIEFVKWVMSRNRKHGNSSFYGFFIPMTFNRSKYVWVKTCYIMLADE